mmetsp:Transcript_44995/g.101908  ORF Transcript_44995/g.101908 Transcript_44995/m.101908 type:complete len:416 (-) Transcript_44995:179-1426(-)
MRFLLHMGLGSIPIVAMLFTWFHIWLALQMMFLPVEFLGCCQIKPGIGIGWQGVVPRKSEKMAKIACDKALPHLMTVRMIIGRLEADSMVNAMEPVMLDACNRVEHRIAATWFPRLYNTMPDAMNSQLVSLMMRAFRRLARKRMPDFQLLLIKNLNLYILVTDAFKANKVLLNDFFRQIGAKEIKFIEHCGAFGGLLCGCVQLVVYQYMTPAQRWYFLPGSGICIGIATNWAALKVCFAPIHPLKIRLFGKDICTLQGIFLRRQHEVCKKYSNLLVNNFFTLPAIVDHLQKSEGWDNFKTLYFDWCTELVDEIVGMWGKRLIFGQGRSYDEFRQEVSLEVFREMQQPAMTTAIEKYFQDETDVEKENARRMTQMSPYDFEQLMHPVFQEDEWILIVLGGALGGIVGLAQAYFLGN